MIARIVTTLALDKTFDYKIPTNLLDSAVIGARVEVPFGPHKRQGFIVEIIEKSDFPAFKLKFIAGVVDPEPLIPRHLVKLGLWMAQYYCCSIEQAVRNLLPGVIRGGKIGKKMQNYLYIPKGIDVNKEILDCEKKSPKQALVLQKLSQREFTLATTIKYELGVSDHIVRTLVNKKIVGKEKMVVERDPFENDVVIASDDKTLTTEQAESLALINQSLDKEKADVILLNGVTGSGKTEVYLQAIRKCVEQGHEAIVLVPEIALTPQTVERFKSRFGNKVSVLHSGLSDGERFDEWMKIHENKVAITVGARSALFAPFQKLGLIIVDEEHENTYKQDEAPRYHARDVAVVRGHLENVTVVLGTATPSFESKYNVQIGKYKETKLTKRVDKQVMPTIRIVDLKSEQDATNQFNIISRQLQKAVFEAIDNGEQVMLFLNRRGYATSMQCMKCGYIADCPECDRPYTYHKKFGQLICHYCSVIHRAPTTCPVCSDPDIKLSGLGTERIESMVRAVFKKARIARMDSDTMGSSKDYKIVLDNFRKGNIDILIGTQMIAKGLHFPNVTLVGILMADMGLNIPDFRAGERTLQLLTQVAGRAGRGKLPGNVIIQTFSPHHPALEAAVTYDYEGFFIEEIKARKMFALPPVTHMAIVHFRGTDETIVSTSARQFFESLKPVLDKDDQMVDPGPCAIEKVAGKYRYSLTIRSSKIMRLSKILRQGTVGIKLNPKVKFHVDIDPYSLM